jgi:CheY-like chemotaxis protein
VAGLPPIFDGRLLRVLVVDDNRDAANALANLLRLWGHSVRTTYDGQSALSLADDFRPHVALLDIQMPMMHGGEVARLLRSRSEFATIKIFATTGNNPDDPRLAAWRHYFDAHFVKPYKLNQLEEILAHEIQCEL